MTEIYVRRAGDKVGTCGKLKHGTIEELRKRHPDWYVIKAKRPSTATMERWVSDGVARTPCRCRVEPDGYCTHGNPSWLLVLWVI